MNEYKTINSGIELEPECGAVFSTHITLTYFFMDLLELTTPSIQSFVNVEVSVLLGDTTDKVFWVHDTKAVKYNKDNLTV